MHYKITKTDDGAILTPKEGQGGSVVLKDGDEILFGVGIEMRTFTPGPDEGEIVE